MVRERRAARAARCALTASLRVADVSGKVLYDHRAIEECYARIKTNRIDGGYLG